MFSGFGTMLFDIASDIERKRRSRLFDKKMIISSLADSMGVGVAEFQKNAPNLFASIQNENDFSSLQAWCDVALILSDNLKIKDHPTGEWAALESIALIAKTYADKDDDIDDLIYTLVSRAERYEQRFSLFNLIFKSIMTVKKGSHQPSFAFPDFTVKRVYGKSHNLYEQRLQLHKQELGIDLFNVLSDNYFETFGDTDVQIYVNLLAVTADIVNNTTPRTAYEMRFKTVNDEMLLNEVYYLSKDEKKAFYDEWSLYHFGKKPSSFKGLIGCSSTNKCLTAHQFK